MTFHSLSCRIPVDLIRPQSFICILKWNRHAVLNIPTSTLAATGSRAIPVAAVRQDMNALPNNVVSGSRHHPSSRFGVN